MTKWEYCELEVSYGMNITCQGWIYRENGVHEILASGKYGAILASLGTQGWELVTSSSHAELLQSKTSTVSYLFKRPVS